ncbi:unnamed protein product [Sphenostylis stenocarpa]|uniref:Uncharacterized protein n=1 Tax=Sphenostylis stenocarpa TaxID=92480 RepID=A0AA86V3Z0_9FABA|nr:unnamed protein product [Sphenostylis stenocarpa]
MEFDVMVQTWLVDMWAREHVGMGLHGNNGRQVGPNVSPRQHKVVRAYAASKPRGHFHAGFVGLRKRLVPASTLF